MRGVDGYYDIIWADVNIEKINAELLDFQNKWVECNMKYYANSIPTALSMWESQIMAFNLVSLRVSVLGSIGKC